MELIRLTLDTFRTVVFICLYSLIINSEDNQICERQFKTVISGRQYGTLSLHYAWTVILLPVKSSAVPDIGQFQCSNLQGLCAIV